MAMQGEIFFRKCKKCGLLKPKTIEHFHRSGASYRSVCRDCYLGPPETRAPVGRPRDDGRGREAIPTPGQVRWAAERDALDRQEAEAAQDSGRIVPYIARYLAARELTGGRGRDYWTAHDELARHLKAHGRSVVVDGRAWCWSTMEDGIVSTPVKRRWNKAEGPTPRVCRMALSMPADDEDRSGLELMIDTLA